MSSTRWRQVFLTRVMKKSCHLLSPWVSMSSPNHLWAIRQFRKSTAKPSKLSTAPGRQTASECAHRVLSRSARVWNARVWPRFQIILLFKSSSDQDLCFTAVQHAPGTRVSSSQSSHRSLSHTRALQPACLQCEYHESSSDTTPLRTP